MLQLDHFFEGWLKKEEVASAFLAMALEGVPAFRHHFFAALGLSDERLGQLHSESWKRPVVEKDRIDVRLESSTHVVLIENKVQAASKQQGQLLRYYKRERRGHERAIVAVYLAPERVGISEVEAVVKAIPASGVGSNDVARHVSWKKVIRFEPSPSEPDEALIKTGLDAIAKAIENATKEVYPDEGERHALRQLFKRAKPLAAVRLKPVRVNHWPGKDEHLETNKTSISVDVKTCLDSVSTSHPTVTGVVENGRFQLPMMATLRKASKEKKNSPVGLWWQIILQRNRLRIPKVGMFKRDEAGDFRHQFTVRGDEAKAVKEITNVMVDAVQGIQRMLEKEGLSLVSGSVRTKGQDSLAVPR